MPAAQRYHTTPDAMLAATIKAFRDAGNNISAAARAMGVSNATVARHLARAATRGMIPKGDLPGSAIAQAKSAQRTHPNAKNGWAHKLLEIKPLPSPIAPIDELLERRGREWERTDEAHKAREKIDIKVKIAGPVGIVHMGDPHIDDPGTDIKAIQRDIRLARATEGMLIGNVGDLQNNWVGRLARLYGEQSTSAAESWALTEWMVAEMAPKLLYLIGGNHDCWSGAGDPLKWIAAHHGALFEGWGARLNLIFPNGKQVRVNARHDFAGHSQWNPGHGPAKAAQMGWRDHLLTCGHKHTSAYQLLKDPSSGLISHVLRVAGYKIHDRYAKELGLPNQNITPASVTIIDPRYADDDVRLVTVIHDVETAADFLTFLRRRK